MNIWERMGRLGNGKFIHVVLTYRKAIVSCYPSGKLHIYTFHSPAYGYRAAWVWAGPGSAIPATTKPSFDEIAEAVMERARHNPRIAAPEPKRKRCGRGHVGPESYTE